MKKRKIWVGALLVVFTHTIAQQSQQETSIDEVSIASKSKQKIHETGKNVFLLTSKDLEKFQGQKLTDVLQTLPGFQISGTFNNSPEPKSPKINGGKAANVLLLLDGIPLKDVTGNDYTLADLRLIALENIESIEVLNGASSVLYGSNASVSVINIKTKKSANKKIQGLLSTRVGSFATFSQNVGIRGKLGNFQYQVNGFNEKSDGISAAKGENFDKDGWEKQNATTHFSYGYKNFEAHVSSGISHHLYHFDSDSFLDGKNRGNDTQYHVGGTLGYTYRKGKFNLNIRHSVTDRLSQDVVNGKFQDQYQYKGDHFFGELLNTTKFSKNVGITGGLMFEKQSMMFKNLPWGATELEEVLKFKETNTASYDAFANANVRHNEFRFDLGARFIHHSKFGNHLVYSFNPYYFKEFDHYFLKAGYSYATAFIAPTLYQNFGALPYTLPNFGLNPETNATHEVDINFGALNNSFSIQASIFERKEKDVFAYRTVDPKTFQGSFFNVEENKVQGFEIGFDYQINALLKMGANYTFIEKEKEATMLRQPKQRINSFFEAKPFPTTFVRLNHLFTSSRNDYYFDYSTYTVVHTIEKGYHLFNLQIAQKVYKKFDAFIHIGNLFNTSFVDIAGFTSLPRNYTIGANYQF